jgi:hypothetical protein
MILVEGCDGAGKSYLIKLLRTRFFRNLQLGPRASTSIGGVSHHGLDGLTRWVDNEIGDWAKEGYGPRIYDRYPLISEPIYGTLIRGSLSQAFLSSWYRSRLNTIRHQALVVFVDPGWDAVKDAVTSDPKGQMDGVVDNAHAIWMAYRTLSLSWTGKATTFIRSNPQSILSTVSMIDSHIKSWRF